MNVMRWSAYPPSENRMTDTSENITFSCGQYQKWHTDSIHQMSRKLQIMSSSGTVFFSYNKITKVTETNTCPEPENGDRTTLVPVQFPTSEGLFKF